MKEKIKIVIADDQELIRDSLKIVLSTNIDMEVIDTVADGREVIRSVRKAKPDVILMDVRMPGMYPDHQGELSPDQDHHPDHLRR